MNTIINRDVSLEKIVQLWSKSIAKKFSINYKDIYKYRLSIIKSCYHNSVDIYTIYEYIWDNFANDKVKKNIDKVQFLEILHEIEVMIEIKHQMTINPTVSLLNKLYNENCKIYCLSDFRLKSEDIRTFFKAKDIDFLFDDVFSSADYGETKKNGKLYNIILNKLNVKADKCIMIGDDYQVDFLNAKNNGIYACLIKK